MQTKRGIAGKPLTLLIIILAIAFTLVAFWVEREEATPEEIIPADYTLGL